MKEYITSHTLANEVRMKRITHEGTVLIVGIGDDKGNKVAFLKRFINNTVCKVVLAHDKDNAIGALNILERDSFKGVVAIVNTNFWKIQEVQPPSKNLFVTDSHDVETMLIQSPALEKFLSIHGSEDKMTTFTEWHNKDIRTVLLESGVTIGYLRWVSHIENLSLEFKGVNFSNFINIENLSIDLKKLVQTIKSHSGRDDITDEDLQEKISLHRTVRHNPWDICSGQDLIHILSIGLCTAIGPYTTADINSDTVEKSLILAYELLDFCQTRLCLSLFQWEIANKPFHILLDTIKSLAISNIEIFSSAIQKLETLIETNARESEFQALLTENPWMFGSNYCQLLKRRTWVLDEQLDFMLRRTIDGYLELIEIKTPLNGEALFREDDSHDNLYPRSELTKAVSQVHKYLESLDADNHRIKATTGEDVRQISAKIIIGRTLDEKQARAIRRYNANILRIEVLTFDQLLSMAKQIVTYQKQAVSAYIS